MGLHTEVTTYDEHISLNYLMFTRAGSMSNHLAKETVAVTSRE